MIENKKLTLTGWTFFSGLVAAVIIGVIFYWFMPHRVARELTPFVLYENGEYVPYTLDASKSEVERAPLATTSEPLLVRYPNGAGLTVSEKGLEWLPSEKGERITLLERTGLAGDAWSIAADGSRVALFNETTGAYDIFDIEYQGAAVTYISSIIRPALPTYTVSIGFATSKYAVLRTGNPEEFLVYKIHEDAIKEPFSAHLKTVAQ